MAFKIPEEYKVFIDKANRKRGFFTIVLKDDTSVKVKLHTIQSFIDRNGCYVCILNTYVDDRKIISKYEIQDVKEII